MALQTSGAISLDQIHVEAGGTSGTQCSINDTDIRDLIGKTSATTMSFNEWYGADANQAFEINIVSNVQELDYTLSYMQNQGWDEQSDIVITISSGVYVWSDDTSKAALDIQGTLGSALLSAGASITIKNYGYIIGRGGNGGYASSNTSTYNGQNGGHAIQSSAVQTYITNYSGAVIAGGGGGGAGASGGGSIRYAGGGGGAGGGRGGGTFNNAGSTAGGFLNAVGADGGPSGTYGTQTATASFGGGAGGGGGGYDGTGASTLSMSGGAGGRKLGAGATGGAGATLSEGANGGNGGTINAGSNATGGGGGGGWGAAGGNSANYTGGSAGRALDGFGTVTNSGSIYGAT
jgi:hypothetical protein